MPTIIPSRPKGTVRIYETKRTNKNGKRVPAFRVKSYAINNELLQHSEILNTELAVEKHIAAMSECWISGINMIQAQRIIDYTPSQRFVKNGLAATGKGGKK